MKQKYTFLLLFCCLVLLGGCSKSDEEGRKNITGTVTLDGVKLEKGTIQITPIETKAPPGAGATGGTVDIKDGKYELKKNLGLFAGTYSVRISNKIIVNARTGEPLEDMSLYMESGPGTYKPQDLLPAKYNTKTELTITVGEDKNQTHDFALTK